MILSGNLIIGLQSVRGAAKAISSVNPSTGERLETTFNGATIEQMQAACALAADAFDFYREVPIQARAAFLERIAENIIAIGDDLIVRCMAETGLPRARLEGERARTVGQLRFFAQIVRDGGFLDARIDPAQPHRQPMPRVDLRLRHIPVGPVAVFGASNFPLAFSVAGGDTASALAAGCPVVVKAHSAHPGTSELVGRAIQDAVRQCDLPQGVFSLLFTSSQDVSQALVAEPRIAAVGFTGSRTGGLALMQVAAARKVPIPVYAEMSSINPVILLKHALRARATEIGRTFVAALTLGSGQFCTNPGLILAIECDGLDTFIASAAEALSGVVAATMLSPGIHRAYVDAVDSLAGHSHVQTIGRGAAGGLHQGQPGLFVTTADAFVQYEELQAEIFGASGLIVRCRDEDQLRTVLEHLEGQLTAAIHMDEADTEEARRLLPLLEIKAGRILVNGFGTGVEVSHAMVHGGPFPSTSDGRTTSVGGLAIQRFLRPISYQDVPETLLPEALHAANPLRLWRKIDGKLVQPELGLT